MSLYTYITKLYDRLSFCLESRMLLKKVASCYLVMIAYDIASVKSKRDILLNNFSTGSRENFDDDF